MVAKEIIAKIGITKTVLITLNQFVAEVRVSTNGTKEDIVLTLRTDDRKNVAGVKFDLNCVDVVDHGYGRYINLHR